MDLEVDVKDIESLQGLAKTCGRILEALLLEENAQAEETTASKGHWVSRSYAEFNLWCVKVGVNGQGLRSIDIRLKDVPEICAVIRNLLKSLQFDLEKIQQPTDDIQHSKKIDVETSGPDCASDSSSLSFDSLSSLNSTGSTPSNNDVTLEEKPILLLKAHVSDTIDRLHGHALQIDKAGAKHRRERVEVYKKKKGPTETYDIYNKIAYRKAKIQFPLASDVLCDRIGESFARRRIRFDYLREHQKKRAIELPKEIPEPSVSLQPKSAQRDGFTKVFTTTDKQAPKASNLFVAQPRNHQNTNQSTTERTKLEISMEKRQERAESVASVALRRPGFPPPPLITGHGFQCPYCRLDFRATEAGKSRWSQHVMEDFEPYFCPVEHCTKPFDLPGHFDGLLQHLQDHVEKRFHIDLPGGEHQELGEEEFEKYITQGGHMSDEDLVIMKKAARRKGAFVFDGCPFCGGYPDVVEKRFPVPGAPEAQVELRRHIRQHMQDIALFLPPYREDVFEDDGDLQSSVFSREQGENSSLENSDDFLIICDRDSCDCKDQAKSSTELTWDPEINNPGSTSEVDAADAWEKLYPGLSCFDRSGLTKDCCFRDNILYQFLKTKLRSAPEDSIESLDAIRARTHNIPESVSQRSRRQKRSTILESFALDDYEIRQREYSRMRCPGTYEWLFDTDAFQTWLSKPSQTFSCYGFPGSGKTMLASAVLDHLVDYFANDLSTGIAFLYCDQDKTAPGAGDDAQDLLTSILKQLAEDLPSISPGVEFLYHTPGDSSVPNSISEVRRTIELVAEGYSKIFIIVDAIDEIQEGPKGRGGFLSEMVKLQKACGLNFFLTSRPIVDITQKFLFLTSLPVEVTTKDFLSTTSKKTNVPQVLGGSIQMDFCATRNDIRSLIEHRMSRLPYRFRRNRKLQQDLESWILDRADGMFLIARAYIDRLEKLSSSDDEIDWDDHKSWDAHFNCTAHCSELFRKLWRRFQTQEHYSLAKKAMRLAYGTRRQLKVVELQHALCTSFVKPFEEFEEGWPNINDILVASVGLLAIDDWSNVISFSHHTAREFLREYLIDVLTTADVALANVCIDCVSSAVFHAGPCSADGEFRDRLRSYPFYSYAASNWGYHACEASLYPSAVIDFLSVEPAAQAAGQALMMSRLPSQQPHRIQSIPKYISGLHLAAYFGVKEATVTLLQTTTPDPKDSHLRTPLMYAAEKGYLALSQLLISSGADVNARDRQGRTSLHLAAVHGHDVVADLLVQAGADITAVNNQHLSPLHIAAEDADSLTVSELLRLGANVNERDDEGMTPLMRAEMRDKGTNAEQLIRYGASVQDAHGNSISALLPAAMMGHDEIVLRLLRKGADIEIRDEQGWTPLLHAAANGHKSTVGILLSWRADIQAKEEDGWDPLLIAASMGHESIVEQLLLRGADIKSTVKGGFSPLLIAAYHGYDSIARLLCEYSSPEDREAKEQFGQTPLLVATRHGHGEVVRTLLHYSVDIEAKEDKFGQTPLLMAVRLGHKSIVELLLDGLADVKATRFDGRDAYKIASVPERKEIYSLLFSGRRRRGNFDVRPFRRRAALLRDSFPIAGPEPVPPQRYPRIESGDPPPPEAYGGALPPEEL